MTMSSIINSLTTIFVSADFFWHNPLLAPIYVALQAPGDFLQSKLHIQNKTQSHLSVKVKNSCLPKHVRVNVLSHPSTGEANFKLACKVCLWGDFYLVYPHLPCSRWATNFPAAETSGCQTIIEVIKKKRKAWDLTGPSRGVTIQK